jgi:hypothetical protein
VTMHGARRAAPSWKRPVPRRQRASGTLLPREQRVKKAAAILAKAVPTGQLGVRDADIEGELSWLKEACDGTARVRSRGGKQAIRAMRTLLAALDRANRPIGGLPEDLRLRFGLDSMIYHLEAYEKFLGTEVVIKRAEKIDKDGKRVTAVEVIPKPRRPKPDAFEKSLAAQAGLWLCQLHKIEPTTTKGGTLCKLAAALYGDPNADLAKHCRAAVKGQVSAKPGQD